MSNHTPPKFFIFMLIMAKFWPIVVGVLLVVLAAGFIGASIGGA